MRLRVLGWAVVLSAINATVAVADWVELSPFLGLRFGGGVFLENIDTDVTQKSSLSYGAVVDVFLTEDLQAELLFSHQQSPIETHTSGQPEKELDSLVTDYFHGGVRYLFQGKEDRVRPFVVGTLGVTRFRPDVRTYDGETKLSFGFGGGAKFLFSSHLGARVEFRGFATPTDVNQTEWLCLYYTCDATVFRQTFWQGELQAGLVIVF